MIRNILGLFVGMDGLVHAETIPVNKREVEFIDGCHPILPATIFYDTDRRGPPLYVCWHGLPFPEGVNPDFQTEKAILKEAFHMNQHKLRRLVSKRWVRLLTRAGITFLKLCIIGFMLGFLVLILLVLL